MDDWVHHPHVHTALDDILPCLDTATANDSMNQCKEVTFQLVTLVNRAILNISNSDFPPIVPPPLNYNQSGPLVPALCNPYLPDMSDRSCLAEEVNFDNANLVWQRYVCNSNVVNGNEICTTVGRLTSTLYSQIRATANVSHGLYHYSPFLTQLVNCGFVRETFSEIGTDNCPGLSRYSKWVYIGLLVVSVALMLALVFWVVFVRERRHRKYNKQFITRAGESPPVGRDKV